MTNVFMREKFLVIILSLFNSQLAIGRNSTSIVFELKYVDSG